MISPLGFVLDEHLRGPLWDAIQAHNAKPVAVPNLVSRAGDSPYLPLGMDDPDILQWAEQKDFIGVGT